MELEKLYMLAEENNIKIYEHPLPVNGSVSLMEPDLSCYIAIDNGAFGTKSEEKTALGHELGHCLTGSFYNRYSTCDVRTRHERRADKKAAYILIPLDELMDALKSPWSSVYDLAEHFGVTENFMRKTLEIYEQALYDKRVGKGHR